jgi:hypothetical protein
MARRKRKAPARAVPGPTTIKRPDGVLEPVYEADPDGRPVVHHRTVDTLGIMLRAGTITQDMHDAARDFQAAFTIARYDVIRCMSLVRLPGGGGPADFTDAQLSARRRVGEALDALGGLGSPAGSCVWHVVGLQRSIREWAMRQGWGGRRCGSSRRRGFWSRGWGCWRGAMGMGGGDRGPLNPTSGHSEGWRRTSALGP